ncbi:MAG: hypothetical protein JO165_04365 [Candidatus Eremiobacteraeota bacterium]|nr:hypothetical protein [Candidatus Eremiobacteraeota bacterium]
MRRLIFIGIAIFVAGCGAHYTPSTGGYSVNDLAPASASKANSPTCTKGCLFVATEYYDSACKCVPSVWEEFAPPFNHSSSPIVRKQLAGANSIAADSAYLATGGADTPKAKVYHLPVTAGSIYFASIPLTGNAVYLAFDKSHDLWVANSNNDVEEFVPPFSSTMHPTRVLSMVNPLSITFDNAKNLYIGRTDSLAGGFTEVRRYAPPYTGSYLSFYPGTFPIAMAIHNSTLVVSGAQAYVANCNCWDLEVFNLPVTSSSSPTQIPFNYGDSAGAIAFDASGNLFVPLGYPAHSAPAGIIVYRPPFTPSNHGAYEIVNGMYLPNSVAIGP